MITNSTVKDICLIGLFSTILFVKEEILIFLPNIQLTFLLIFIYTRVFKLRRTICIVVVYFLLDSIFMSSLNPILISFQLIGWLIIPICLSTIFNKINSNIILAFLGILFSLTYSWIMIIPNMIIYEIGFIPYLTADLIFEVLLSASNFLSILLLYKPLSKVLSKGFNRFYGIRESK